MSSLCDTSASITNDSYGMKSIVPVNKHSMITKKRFFGGVHPSEYKYANPHNIQDIPVPSAVWIPVSQHIGTPAEIIVAIGQKVKKGELIGRSHGLISAAVHASISGEVKAIEPVLLVTGKQEFAVHIISDGADDACYDTGHQRSLDTYTSEGIIDCCRNSGIVGMGGAAFPSAVKLKPPADKPIDTVILNGVECEPYITCDHALMLACSHGIIAGLRAIMKAVHASSSIVAIEANKTDAVDAMRAAAAPFSDIRIVMLPVRYPQGAEKQLIQAVLHREVPSGGLPMDAGVLVHNVATAFALYEGITYNKPLIERIVTMTGDGMVAPVNVRVRIGTLVSDILQQIGGIKAETVRLIAGGPMMGISVGRVDIPLVKGMNAVIALQESSTKRFDWAPCIRCSRCVAACPIRLNPAILGVCAEKKNADMALSYQVKDCIECGCCAYQCPSSRPLVHFIKYLKYVISKRPKVAVAK